MIDLIQRNRLAIELKQAGFPQGSAAIMAADGTDEGAYIPTLSELIEACKGNFYALQQGFLMEWDCYGSTNNMEKIHVGAFTSPEEAVARLWLFLNKK